MNKLPHWFKVIVVIMLGVFYVVAVKFFADEVRTERTTGPRSPVEVQDPLPHRPVQEYEVE